MNATTPSLKTPSFKQKLGAEFAGTAALLCAVVGSGIMAERLAGGNDAVALLANTLSTVFALFVLIEIFGPISGAHFNPLVTLVTLFTKVKQAEEAKNNARAAIFLIASQLIGAAVGTWLAHAMFGLDLLQTSQKLRGGLGQWIAEAVATGGLIFVILRSPLGKASTLVACYIGAAYWFTASTSFANPAAVLGRLLSDSFAGIAPASAPGFVLAQCLGAVAGAWLARRFDPV